MPITFNKCPSIVCLLSWNSLQHMHACMQGHMHPAVLRVPAPCGGGGQRCRDLQQGSSASGCHVSGAVSLPLPYARQCLALGLPRARTPSYRQPCATRPDDGQTTCAAFVITCSSLRHFSMLYGQKRFVLLQFQKGSSCRVCEACNSGRLIITI